MSSITDETATRATPRSVVPRNARAFADVGVLTLLSLIGVLGFASSFDRFAWLPAGIGGLVIGTGVAFLSWRLRLGTATTIVLAIAAYFLLGSAFAHPGDTIAVVIPTLDSLAGLAIGAVFGWADVLTLRAPVELPDYVSAVPLVAAWAVSLLSTTLALRWLSRRKRTAWRSAVVLLAPLALYATGVLLGTAEPFFSAVRGVTFAVVALLWIGWRRGTVAAVSADGARSLFRAKLIGTASVVVAAGVVGALVGTAAAPVADNRFVLREEITPPFEPLTYPSPFTAYRKYTKTLEETTLFRVDGLQPGERMRLATLDAYDGTIWGVAGAAVATAGSGSFSLVGRSIPDPPLFTSSGESRVHVTIADYDDVWIPSIGAPERVAFDDDESRTAASAMRLNPTTGTAVLTTGLSSGAGYEVVAQNQLEVPTDQLLTVPTAQVELAPVDTIPDVVAAKAKEYAGSATTPIEQLRAIENVLRSTGYLSHGSAGDTVASRAGQGADRMVELFERTSLVGDEEQYATAMALMARSLGYPARVVMGFAPEVTEGAASVDVKGADVTAWVEVPFEGVGWISFSPTPDRTDIPQDQVPKPQSEPQPQVRQPPRSENQENDLVAGVEIEDTDDDDAELFSIPAWVWIVGISILVPLLIIFIPLLVIGVIKGRRMARRRRSRGDLSAAGAWDELVDRFSELGYEVPDRATRSQTATRLEGQVPTPIALVPLARSTDDAVFSGREIDDDQSATVWTEAMAAVDVARSAASAFRRIVSRYRVSAARRWARRVAKAADAAARQADPRRR